jgi:probable HAF family extracellular repeat protein
MPPIRTTTVLFLTAALAFTTLGAPGTRTAKAAGTTPAYTITSIGPIGSSVIRPFAVNDRGQAVGQSSAPSGTTSDRAFFFDSADPAAGAQILPLLAGRPELARAQANDINHAGQVVGYCESPTADPVWSESGFLWDSTNGIREIDQIADSSGATAATLGWTIDLTYAINASGDILCYSVSRSQKCLWHMATDANGVRTLTVKSVPDTSGAGPYTDLNDSGVVLTQAVNPSTGMDAFALWDSAAGRFNTFIDPAFKQGYALNNLGVAVSHYGQIYRPGAGVSLLGSLGSGGCSANAVNDANQVVGISGAKGRSGVNIAFFWQNGMMQNLQSLTNADRNWTLNVAWGMSNPTNPAGTAGYVVGWGSYKNQAAGWVLTPR